MKVFKLYLETTLWNYLVDPNPELSEKRSSTEALMRSIQEHHFEGYISALVTDEIERTEEPKRSLMLQKVNEVKPLILPIIEEIRELASVYLEEGAIPKQKPEDALHLAIATINELDAVVSWNYRHIVNLRRKELVHAVNLREGFTKPLETLTPLEVVGDEDR